MNKFFVSAISVLVMSPTYAKNISELALDCVAQYKVLESRNYYAPPYYRVSERNGTIEVQEVLDLYGKDCKKFEKFYGVKLTPGQVLGKGAKLPPKGGYTGEDHNRIGKIFEEKVHQNFAYQTEKGELPLFPTVHTEWATLMGVSGQANVKELYGTQELKSLPEGTKVKLVKDTMWILNHGKDFGSSSYLDHYQGSFFRMILELEFAHEVNQKEYLSDLLLMFSNGANFKSSLLTLEPLTKLGGKINQLMNATGGTKWSTPLEILKREPLLLHTQIIQWTFNGEEVPKLSSAEMEEFLAHSLEVGNNLKKVPQIHEAQALLSQYKSAVEAIQSNQGKFEVSTKALDLIAEILAI